MGLDLYWQQGSTPPKTIPWQDGKFKYVWNAYMGRWTVLFKVTFPVPTIRERDRVKYIIAMVTVSEGAD